MNIRSTALALALAGLASNASADLISYEFELHPINVPQLVINGYITVDDALMQSQGSGDLVAWDLEFERRAGCTFGFGYECGNDFSIFSPGPPPTTVSGHRPHSIAGVTFADGVPVAMSYGEQHFYPDSPKGWSMLDIRPTAGSFPPPFLSATWELETYSSSLFGTYSFGPPIPAVPEPETWALLLSGLAVIGAGSRRRRIERAQPATTDA